MNLLKKIRTTISRHDLLACGDTVIVGVSGGSDSVCLLNLLIQLDDLKLKPVIAHVNHCLRGKESQRDADFVGQLAANLGLEFELLVNNVVEFAHRSGRSVEESGRIIRYDFFNEVSKKHNADKIATAHTLDDQVETVLMRFIRGSGIKGLAGIPYFREPNIIRPLLDISKKDIKKFLADNRIKWVEDSSNLGEEFLRNRIRLYLIPALKELNPNLESAIARTSEIFSQNESYISKAAAKAYKKVFKKHVNGLYIGDLRKFNKLHTYMKYSLIRESIARINENLLNIDFDHTYSAMELLNSGKISGEINLPGDVIVAKSYYHFVVTHKSEINPRYSYKVDSFGKHIFKHLSFEIKKEKVTRKDLGSNTALISPDKFKFPIEIRNFRPGDKFVPFGMKGEKKLKDFFIDEKIPRYLRKLYPLFIINGEIAWIGGLRMSDKFRVTGKNAIGLFLNEKNFKSK